jgi:putative colanic acid biosynthesis acetyltransferase WcaF
VGPLKVQKNVDLARYSPGAYRPGSLVRRALWYAVDLVFFSTPLPWPSIVKRNFLRAFGAEIGRGVVIKPRVQVKYPWFLRIGDHCWLGERVWIDNLATVEIGDHCCLSQGALLLTGNHDWSSASFSLVCQSITLENGVWIGARAVVTPGVVCGEHAVLSVGSVATKALDPRTVYTGNPAVAVKQRQIK